MGQAPPKTQLIERYAACSACTGELTVTGGTAICATCSASYPVIDGDILSTVGDMTEDRDFSQQKWDDFYGDEALQEEYERIYCEEVLPIIMPQLAAYMPDMITPDTVFLEVGCGRATLGEEMARRGWFFIGIDYSLHILERTRNRLEHAGIDNYLLIHGDLTAMPLKDNTIDFIYGGGVIEHFEAIQQVVTHLHRVLKPGGVSFNSVPFFNIGNVVYRSLWGSIPNVPVLRQLAELIHLRLLGGRHMRFGFELQHTTGNLRRVHRRAGFQPDQIIIARWDYTVTLEFVKHPLIRRFCIHLIKTNRQFWQMVKIIAVKSDSAGGAI